MNSLFQSPLGAVLARPWVDTAGLTGLKRWYLPLSRLWAAANASNGEVDAFRGEIGAPLSGFWPDAYLTRLLRRHGAAQSAAHRTRTAWEKASFGGATPVLAGELDFRRRTSATRHLLSRGLFYPLIFPRRPPPARWQIVAPDALDRELAEERRDPAARYAVPVDAATVEQSVAFQSGGVRESWVRAPTPSPRSRRWPASNLLYARIVEPAGRPAHGTLVLGSGLCLETDLIAGAKDAGVRLAGLGWRSVEPVSPYHGLRAEKARYGGEPFFAEAPLAAFDLISGQAVESALLIAWARRRFGGKVALGGISMTSFVAQQAASYCHVLPAEARPDAVILISHSGRIQDVTFGGDLTAALGLDRALLEAGWTEDRLGEVAALIDPAAEPALPAARIVSVLGQTDRWVPYAEGLDVARRWKLPDANVFRYRLGHLGMPVQLMRDAAPFERLRQVLASAA
jgi:hypothetical protein